MVRISITIDRETLRLADREARRTKSSRSDIIRIAIRSAVKESEQAPDEAAVRIRQRKAIAAMNRLARKFGDWPAQQILHNMRYPMERCRLR